MNRSLILLYSFLLVALIIGVLQQPALGVTYVYLDGLSQLDVSVPDTITVTADCAQAGNRVTAEVYLDLNENGVVDGQETLVRFVYITDGIPTLENGQGDEIVGDDDAQVNGLMTRDLELLKEDFSFSTVPVQFIVKITDQDHSTAQAILRILPPVPGQPYIGGMVTEAGSGSPLEGMVVIAHETTLDEQKASLTDQQGRYVLDVEAGDWTVHAWDLENYYAPADSQMINVLAQDSAVVDFVLSTYPGYITGSVKSGGDPVPGIMIVAAEADKELHVGWTQEDGSYRIGVAPGTYDVYPMFLPSGYAAQPPSHADVVVDSGMVVENKNFTLGQPASRIEGRVTYQGGGGAQGVTINAFSIAGYYYSTITDAEGNFSMSVFAAQYIVSAFRAGYDIVYPPPQVYLFVNVAFGETVTGLDFIIEPSGAAPAGISGTVTYQASGDPAEDVYVVIFNDEEDSPLGWGFAETDGDGFYEFIDVLPGTWLIGAYQQNYTTDPLLREGTIFLGGPPATDQDFELVMGTGVISGDQAETPLEFRLLQNRPNPFNAETLIAYALARGSSERVTLKIFNVLGQEIRTLVDEVQPGGLYLARWDGRDHQALQAASGVYFAELRAGSLRHTRKLVLMR